eukprot:TRINITY_DN5898_c0_g1_i1.p1 TRINITY_DN5898_c0_g1~~TRINITY_DN5898_c0_g1_i1.p1  ORF type:complete len:275 (-),score=60.92 TRINITY_DN5898_c0_g1_i1:328-1152(-)
MQRTPSSSSSSSSSASCVSSSLSPSSSSDASFSFDLSQDREQILCLVESLIKQGLGNKVASNGALMKQLASWRDDPKDGKRVCGLLDQLAPIVNRESAQYKSRCSFNIEVSPKEEERVRKVLASLKSQREIDAFTLEDIKMALSSSAKKLTVYSGSNRQEIFELLSKTHGFTIFNDENSSSRANVQHFLSRGFFTPTFYEFMKPITAEDRALVEYTGPVCESLTPQIQQKRKRPSSNTSLSKSVPSSYLTSSQSQEEAKSGVRSILGSIINYFW